MTNISDKELIDSMPAQQRQYYEAMARNTKLHRVIKWSAVAAIVSILVTLAFL